MEMCDVFDGGGMRTGRSVMRGTELQPGEYYLAVHVWIRDEAGEYLVQQRASHLASGPGVWATTVGYVLAGEESISAAIRETMEELGIRLLPTQLRRWDRLKTENRIEYLWLAEVSKDLIGTPTLGSEVTDWKWASKRALRQLINQDEFFAYSYFDMIPE